MKKPENKKEEDWAVIVLPSFGLPTRKSVLCRTSKQVLKALRKGLELSPTSEVLVVKQENA